MTAASKAAHLQRSRSQNQRTGIMGGPAARTLGAGPVTWSPCSPGVSIRGKKREEGEGDEDYMGRVDGDMNCFHLEQSTLLIYHWQYEHNINVYKL